MQTVVLTVRDSQHHSIELGCTMKVGRSVLRDQTVRWELLMANIKYKRVTTAAMGWKNMATMAWELPVLRSNTVGSITSS